MYQNNLYTQECNVPCHTISLLRDPKRCLNQKIKASQVQLGSVNEEN